MSSSEPRVLIVPASEVARKRTVGGGERYAMELARALSVRTPTTHALFDTTPGEDRDGSLTLRTFGVHHTDSSRFLFPATGATWQEISGYDIVHVLCFPTPLSEAIVLRNVLRRCCGRRQKMVLTDVGGGAATLGGKFNRLHPRLNLHRMAHGLAHLSDYAGRFFSDWSHPAVTLFGGVNPQLLGNQAGDPAGYALYVGRLLRHKGVLEAIQAVPATTPFHVVGRPYDPAYFEELKSAAQGKQVRFITDADDAELARQYAGASVVLQVSLPSTDGGPDKSELLGLVALEGMAGGKPVIVTRTTSLPELVVDGETGFIVPPRDLGALGAKMALLVGNPDLSRRLGRQAREHVQRRFTWDKTADVALDFYRRLLTA